jgi:hypothetical protein
MALAALFAAGPAHAFEVALVGQMEATDPKFDPGLDGTTQSIVPGGGLLFSHYVKSVVGLEVGALFTGYRLLVDTPPTSSELNSRYFQFPIMLRIQPDPTFSFGVGYYLAMSASSTASQTINTGTSETTSDVTLVDRAKSDHGIVFGGQGRIPFPKSKRVSFLLDGRFLIGRHNLSDDPARSLKYNHIQLLLGVAITIGKTK